MSARSIRVLPEQKGFSPARCHPSAARRAVVPSAPGRAAQTPYVAPGDGTRPASARMANASTWPSANRASERSCAAQLASASKRAAVPPEPGFGSSVPHSAAISLNSIQGVNCYPFIQSSRRGSLTIASIGDATDNWRGASLARPVEEFDSRRTRSPVSSSIGVVPLWVKRSNSQRICPLRLLERSTWKSPVRVGSTLGPVALLGVRSQPTPRGRPSSYGCLHGTPTSTLPAGKGPAAPRRWVLLGQRCGSRTARTRWREATSGPERTMRASRPMDRLFVGSG